MSRPDPDPSTTIEQHLDAGQFSLDLTKSIDSPSTTSSTPSLSSTISTSPTRSPTPQPSLHKEGPFRDPILGAHIVLSFIGFMVLLPAAALIARWGRTRSAVWFKAHWLITVVFGIPTIVIGWVLGPLSMSRRGRAHIVNEHQVIAPCCPSVVLVTKGPCLQIGGVILFGLYILQISLGTHIHLRRPKQGNIHPPRNVVHVVLGLFLLGFSMFQVSVLLASVSNITNFETYVLV